MNTTALMFLFTTVTAKLGLPAHLLPSLCYVESTHKIEAINYNDGGSNSVGVCQIKLKTAKWLGFKGTEKELMLPKNNIYYAGLYLKYQIKRYNGNYTKAIIAYNMGNARALTQTNYSAKVNKVWKTTMMEVK